MDFAVRLLMESAAQDQEEDAAGNTLISPMSLLYVLSMTANGARENTLRQMEEVLGLSMEEMNPFLYQYRKTLPSAKKYKVSLANSIWYADGANFIPDPDFLQRNVDYYNAEIFSAKFNEETREAINAWGEKNTDGMIPEVLSQISEDAVMYLVNAVSFDAQWQEIYKENQISDGSFTNASGKRQQADFMASQESVYLEDGDAAVGFLKYYADKKYAFAALLPGEEISVKDYIGSLTGERLFQILSDAKQIDVEANIPRFSCSSSYEMKEILSRMGMKDAFDYVLADFTGMGSVPEERNLYINRVIHKARIEVGGEGTKAGAASVVEMMDGGSSMWNMKSVCLNRPFVYLIIDCEANLPLFMGTVMGLEE